MELRCGVEYVTRDYSFGRFSVAGNPTAQRAKQDWRVKVGGGGPIRIRSRKRLSRPEIRWGEQSGKTAQNHDFALCDRDSDELQLLQPIQT